MDKALIQILADEDFPRLRYIAGIILGDIMGLSWEIVTDETLLGNNPVICYSSVSVKGAFCIPRHRVISEKSVSEKQILARQWKNLPVIFVDYGSYDIPFDIFAASFFLVSRYEEYLPFTPDAHGRFRASSSVAFRNGFLDIPIVDLWALEFGKELCSKFPDLVLSQKKFRSLLTVDTDQPFKYLGKSFLRSAGGIIRDLFSAKGRLNERVNTILGRRLDPFFVYDYILDAIKSSKTESKFFFLLGDHSSNDPNPSWKNNSYRNLIVDLAENYEAGIHPSYYSFRKCTIIEWEIARLQNITGKPVTGSRFHFIRFTIPDSFRCLINAGIVEDYSMGYPDEPGFRAGIARPFFFYDVLSDQTTNLRLIPFMVMDVTLSQYKQLGPEESEDVINALIGKVRAVGGLFVSLWHNNSLQEAPEGDGWRRLFESMLKMQQP